MSDEIIWSVQRSSFSPPTRRNRILSDNVLTDRSSIDNNYLKIRRVLVIGCGGVGANLIYSLARLGYSVAAIDDDTTDEKFFRRFLFGQPSVITSQTKLEFIQDIVKSNLNVSIESFVGKFQNGVAIPENITTFMSNPFICICATDSTESRKYIEASMKNIPMCKFFTHVGCNLNSVSLFKTANGLINEPINENSSYDTEPDQLTYMDSITTIIHTISDIETSIDNEFKPSEVRVQMTDRNEFSPKERAEGFFMMEHNGMPCVCKGATIQLDQISYNGTTRPTTSDLARRTRAGVIIIYNLITERTYVKTPDLRIFLTPHTYSSGSQCTGTISHPRNNTKQEYMRFLKDVEASICVANFNSLASSYFGNVRIARMRPTLSLDFAWNTVSDRADKFEDRLRYVFNPSYELPSKRSHGKVL